LKANNNQTMYCAEPTYSYIITVSSEIRCSLRLRYVDLVVSIEVVVSGVPRIFFFFGGGGGGLKKLS
jgi:hypothetical protein